MVNRTYVRWKYTCLFAYKKERSIYLYIMNICSRVGTRTLSLPRPYSFLSIILYLYTEMRNTLSRTLPFLLLSFRTFVYLYTLLLYTLYTENTLSRHSLTPFHYPYYTPIIYRRGNTFPAPFYPFIKWTPLHCHFPYFSYSLGESLRGKVFENFISIVL